MEMKPEQIRERMELFGLGTGKKESDAFLRSICDAYENLYYQLVEKEDKVSTLSDAVRYYKDMENNMAQMLSTISDISEKTEQTAEKAAQLTIKEAEGKADEILADASEQAAQIVEEAKQEAERIKEHAQDQIADSKQEAEEIRAEFEAYAFRFYEFMEKQKVFFEEHRIDLEQFDKIAKANMFASTPFAAMQQISRPSAVPVTSAIQPSPAVLSAASAPAVPVSPAAITCEQPQKSEEVSINQVRKLPNISAHKEPDIHDIEARIPEEVKNIPISDHTETLDEIIQSIKKSYEEVENMEMTK